MNLARKLSRFALAAALLISAAASQAEPLLQSGDRMVFLGDSITEQRIYTRYVMNYFALRCPDASITFRNAGWSGDTAPGGLKRLGRDVLSLKPTVVSICFGMNDGGVGPFRQATYARFMTGMTALVDTLKGAGIRVVLLTPGCVDPDQKSWIPIDKLRIYNATLAQFAHGVELLAGREHLPAFNIHTLMLDVQTRAKADDPQFTMIRDSVHPNPPGQALMAYGLLKALDCDEQPSGLTIDAAARRAIPDRCKVRDLKLSENSISFTRTDAALPTWFDPEAAPAFKYCPITDELNQYRFKATRLKAGTWKLTVEGLDVGQFASGDLANGVNLAALPGPWRKLGEEVNRLCAAQENAYFSRWRKVSLAEKPSEAELARLDLKIAETEAARAKAVSNRAWRWTLALVK